MCGKDAGAFDIYQRLTVAIAPGQKYAGEAYVRAPRMEPAALAIEGAFIVYDQGTNKQRRSPTPGPPLTSEYQQVSALVTVLEDGGVLEFSVASMADTGSGCFVADDARVYPVTSQTR